MMRTTQAYLVLVLLLLVPNKKLETLLPKVQLYLYLASEWKISCHMLTLFSLRNLSHSVEDSKIPAARLDASPQPRQDELQSFPLLLGVIEPSFSWACVSLRSSEGECGLSGRGIGCI